MVRYVVIAIVALAAVGWGYTEIMARLTHVFEYDARITTDLVTMSSRRDGQLLKLEVEEGQKVKAGAVLARLDDRIPRLEAEAIQARLASLDSDRARLGDKQQMMDQQTGSRISSRTSELQANQAKRASLRAELALAEQDLNRVERLFSRKVISRARLDEARATVGRLRSDVAEAEAQMQRARGAIAETEAGRGEVEMIDQEMAMLDHQATALRAELEQKRVEIEEHIIHAPIAGVIDRLFVEEGEYVRVGQRVLMMHDPDAVWVEANIKETELRLLKLGQPVHVFVDAFPDADVRGTIERVGSATTAKFALLPTPNPSGNFTKITQRVPVRIALDRSAAPDIDLSPGMMVEVEIDVRK
ncbi:MAG: HlyD family secretion protein [Alphaproteobacteria bacterium]|nr:HlyD family secretion protein [Alphaproteobacteria bacterium]MCB9928073.1 HlyD family secretion protein [Alphaproteobacteria bacterium]